MEISKDLLDRSNNDNSLGIALFRERQTLFPSPVVAKLLIFMAIVIIKLLVFKATAELR